jgi:putative membrane protein
VTMEPLLAAATGLAAAGMHAYIFTLESVRFSRTATLRMLEVQPQHADAVRLWAYHQGVYNLLLALTAAAGAALALTGDPLPGRTLLWASSTTMVVAALALLLADRRPARVPGFLAQAVPPLLTIAALTV